MVGVGVGVVVGGEVEVVVVMITLDEIVSVVGSLVSTYSLHSPPDMITKVPCVDRVVGAFPGEHWGLSFIDDGFVSDYSLSSIILVHEQCRIRQREYAATIKVDNPKLVFAKVANRFFPPMGCADDGFGFVRDTDGSLVRFPHYGTVIYGDDVEIGKHVAIDRGSLGNTIIGDGVKIDNLVHVAHNVTIGDHSLIVAGTVLGGSCTIGKRCFIGMNATIRNGITIGNDVTVGMGSVVTKNIPSGETWAGNPARKFG